MQKTPLVVHVIYRLAVGGLENGLVNLINGMPVDRFRHVIVCADTATEFSRRIKRSDVDIYELKKKPGNDLYAQYRLWRILRKLQPDIVHTRNLGTIEYSIPAFLAGVKYRVHGEHGRDMSDIIGKNRKYIFLRRIYNPFLQKFIALSKDLEMYLQGPVGINPKKVVQLYNGVDVEKFVNKNMHRQKTRENSILIGTVGRLQAEKDQATLIHAFDLLRKSPDHCDSPTKIRLAIIGDGPDRTKLEILVNDLGLMEDVVFMGARDDVPKLMQTLDIFVLPSLGEGISNTILEAMASGLPVVATSVGGNPELLIDGQTGFLVPSASPEEMAEVLRLYLEKPELIEVHGNAGRKRVEEMFSLDSMINAYMVVYDNLLGRSDFSLDSQ